MSKRGWRAVWSVAVLGAVALAPAVAGPRVTVDGKQVRGTRIYTIGGHTMVPVRGVVERISGTIVHWEPERRTIVVSRHGQRVDLRVESGLALVNGKSVPLDAPVVMRDGTALMPARFVSEVLGAGVAYDAKRDVVAISSNAQAARTLGYRDGMTLTKQHAPGRLALGGVEILTFRTPGQQATIEERVDQATEALTEGMDDVNRRGGFRASKVWLSHSNQDPVIYVGQKPLARVTPADAQEAGKTQEALGEEWAAQVRSRLARVYSGR